MSGGSSTPPPPPGPSLAHDLTGTSSSSTATETDLSALRTELDATKKQLKENEHQFAKLKSISRKALEEFHRVKDDLARELAQRQESEDRLAKTHEELIREATRRKHLEQLLQATAARPDAYVASLTSPHGSPVSNARALPGASASSSLADAEQARRELRAESNRRHELEAALASVKKDNARLSSELTQVQAAMERAKAREREDQAYIDQLEQVIDDIKADLRIARRQRDDLEAELVATQEMLTAAKANAGAAESGVSVTANIKMPPARPARPTLSDDDDDSRTIRSKPGVLDAVDSDASDENAPLRDPLNVEDDDAVSDSDSIKSNRGNSRETTPPVRPRRLDTPATNDDADSESDDKRYSIVTSIVTAFDPTKDGLLPPPPMPNDAVLAAHKRELLLEVQELEALRDKLRAEVTRSTSSVSTASAAAAPASAEASATIRSTTSGSTAATPPPVPSKKDASAPLPPIPQSSSSTAAAMAPQVIILTPTVINPQDVPREASLAHAAANGPTQPTVLIRPPRFASIPAEDNVDPDDSASQVGADDYADLSDAEESRGQRKDATMGTPIASAAEAPTQPPTSPLHGLTRAERKAMLSLDPIAPLPPPRMAPSLGSPKQLGNVRDPVHGTSPPPRKTTFDSPSSSNGAISPSPPSPIPPLPLSKVETPPQDRSASPSLSIRDSPGMARRMSADHPVPASPSREGGFMYANGSGTSTGLGAKRQKKPSKFNLGFSNMTSAFAKIKDKISDDLHYPGHAHATAVYGPAAFTPSSPLPTPTSSQSSASTNGPGARKGSLKPISSPIPSQALLSPLASSTHDVSLDDASSGKSVNLTGDKSHIFQSTHFHKIVKCVQCGDRIWGSMGGAREMSCKCCGLIAHAKCAPLVPARCPGPAEGPGVPSPGKAASAKSPHLGAARWFGIDLTVAMADKPPGTVPDIIEHCIGAVEKIGMDVEGIYRKSGPSLLTKQAVAELDRGQVPDLANEEIYGDATVATSVLKQYLRDLPNPLITFGVYPLVKQAMHLAEKDPEHGVDCMRKALTQLPVAHLATLDQLFAHLHRVVKAQDVTRMTPRNLGVVFGPTLIRDTSRGESFFDMASIDVVEFMLEHYDDVFAQLVPGGTGGGMDALDLNEGGEDESGRASGASTPPTLPALNLPSLTTNEGLMDFALLFDSKRATPASEKEVKMGESKPVPKTGANVSSSA